MRSRKSRQRIKRSSRSRQRIKRSSRSRQRIERSSRSRQSERSSRSRQSERSSRSRQSERSRSLKKSRESREIRESVKLHKLYKLYKSTIPTKKFDIWIENPKTGNIKKVSFGARGYEDYSIHKDKERRERYRMRHRNDKIKDPTSPGFFSWHILWGNSTSINKNLKEVLNKYF